MPNPTDAPVDQGDRVAVTAPPGSAPPESKLPPEIQVLADREQAAATGHGPELDIKDQLTLNSWRKFPDQGDGHYRDLFVRDMMDTHGGPGLNIDERADLYSYMRHPGSSDEEKHLRQLAANDIKFLEGKGQKPTPAEEAELLSKETFPRDAHYRDLMAADILSINGAGPPLSQADQADLRSKQEFPDNDYFRKLARRSDLASYDPDYPNALTRAEAEELQLKRESKNSLAQFMPGGGAAPHPMEIVGDHKT